MNNAKFSKRIKGLKKWLIDEEYTQTDIRRDLGCSKNLVWRTINGIERNKRIMRWLRDHGCPERLLAAPQKKAA